MEKKMKRYNRSEKHDRRRRLHMGTEGKCGGLYGQEQFARGFRLSARLTKLLYGVGVNLYAGDHALHDHALDRGTGCVSELTVSFHKGHLRHGCIGMI